ncbi:RAMP superfamily CRISPR-associated protein [Propionibacterium australiense]|uniref:CRISPR type III-associated RAMP protein n=1 Tax=Propionibacterium australiense TaxID=119981 RepID=A0A383S4Y8_9ACTN|nr:RAMP superfamily CRISPR-associated protein [Propionibacterium australiense]RLP10056.1 hypothetical protein D9T14_05850 [Propionibacterium australiense]RLP11341.1 hypothetical protein D7U36_04290 [Propionibacterium australiense]SYZ32977.1 CRISPR type III-associated RAMP protein [Propionibacterium australiense]VEH92315.1 CRISPR-associated RAMP protein, SSO1426 family [Propionibacterium australiense]
MKRTYVRVTLQLESSWRIGAWDSSGADTVSTLTAPGGAPVVPGSSIAGSLRHAVAKELREQLFGPELSTESTGNNKTKLSASPWWVLGTVVRGAEITQRQRNRIDRTRGSASERALYRVEEVVPPENTKTEVLVYLRREHEPGEQVIEPLLEALRAWRPRVGGGASIGMGRARITELVHRTLDLDDPGDLMALVSATGGGPDGQDDERPAPAKRADALLQGAESVSIESGNRTMPPYLDHVIKALLHQRSDQGHGDQPFLTAELAVDFLAVPDVQADRIHGSSWKGLLRSRVEYIGRSLGHVVCGAGRDETGGDGPETDTRHREVGTQGADGGDPDTGDEQWTGCGHCAVCRFFGSTERPGVVAFADSPFEFTGSGQHEVRTRQRIAIDRFTGGVRDGALWPQLYLQDVRLRLVVDVNPLAAALSPSPGDEWVGQALLHSLRDLDDGLIGVGPEGAAGYGTAKVDSVMVGGERIDLGDLDPIPAPTEKEAAS